MSSAVGNETQQGAVALKENRIEEALVLLQSAVVRAPNDFTANHLLGVALGKAGRRPESIARLMTATRLNSSSAAAQTHLGMAYAAADKPDLARSAYEAALRVDPSFAPAKIGLTRLPDVPAKPIKTAAKPVGAAPTPWNASSQAPAPLPAVPTAKATKPKASQPGDKSLWDDIAQVQAESRNEKREIDWGPMLLQAGGALVFVLGIFLWVGNVLGFFRTFMGAGYITMMIGGAMWKAA